MVLVVELLLGVGILAGVYRVATRDGDLAPLVEPDGPQVATDDRPLSADDVAAYRLSWGVGYRKADVDRLLDRVARQLPRAGEEWAAGEPVGDETSDRVQLAKVQPAKVPYRPQEEGHG
ncbi:MAG: hypothetical protein QOG60_2354 [Frankiaceae bacterium]|nr:hypothetical protein [Frankiaceae bacterium]